MKKDNVRLNLGLKSKVYFENSSVKQLLECKVNVTSVAEVPIFKSDTFSHYLFLQRAALS